MNDKDVKTSNPVVNQDPVVNQETTPVVESNVENGIMPGFALAPTTPGDTSGNVIDYTRAVAQLSQDEKDELRTLTASLDPENLPSIYDWKEASDLNHVIGTNADKILSTMGRNSAASDIVALLDELSLELHTIKFDEQNPSTFKVWVSKLPVIGKFVDVTETLILKYEKDSKEKVDMITQKFETTQTLAQANNTTLQGMIENTQNYINRMDKLLMAATLKMQEIDAEINRLQVDPNADMNRLRNLYDFKHLLDKKITSLQGNRGVMMAGVIQLKGQQMNNLSIMETANDIVTNNIPTLKHNLVAAQLLEQQAQSVEAINKFKEGYNQIMVKTSEKQKQVSIQVAKNSENGILDIAAFNEQTNNIIEMIETVNRINAEGEVNRAKFREQILEQTKRIEAAATADPTTYKPTKK